MITGITELLRILPKKRKKEHVDQQKVDWGLSDWGYFPTYPPKILTVKARNPSFQKKVALLGSREATLTLLSLIAACCLSTSTNNMKVAYSTLLLLLLLPGNCNFLAVFGIA